MNRRGVLALGAIALAGAGALAFTVARPKGYGATVDFRAVLAPPPAAGSPADRADRAAFAATAAGIGGPAWRLAATQVFPTAPDVIAQLSCAIGRQVTPATTPVTARLIANAAADLKGPVDAAKAFYRRDRPFVHAADPATCDPRTLGSLGGASGGVLTYAYPSGHAAQGELIARTLVPIVPDRAAAITAWGRQLGDNRVACRVHWLSDVAAGRALADALYAQLQSRPGFRADAAAARAELALAPPAPGCHRAVGGSQPRPGVPISAREAPRNDHKAPA